MEHYGPLSLLPTVCVLVLALWTRRTFEALLGGSIVGFVILGKAAFFDQFVVSSLAVMQDETVAWILLVCGLFGSLIRLLIASGGTQAFAQLTLRYVRTRRQALLTTWALGLSIFIDDYLNALTIGSSMRRVTDKFRVSREMLAYVVDSTAAPVCVLVPLSTWAIYLAGLIEESGLAPAGAGLQFYLQVIPFALYGWAAVLLVPIVACHPRFAVGPMRRAEQRAATGELAPAGSAGFVMEDPSAEGDQPPRLSDFALPIAVLIAATVAYDIDALKGVLVATAFAVGWMLVTRRMTFATAMDHVVVGFQSMVPALAIIVASFVLKDVNDRLGLAAFVIEAVEPWMSRAALPAVAFATLSLITFATGSFWGVYAIATPILVPLAAALDVDQRLAVGAMVSAGAFGSHACFYGDASVLSASAAGCNNMAHVVTQLPYALVAAAASVAGYLVLGLLL